MEVDQIWCLKQHSKGRLSAKMYSSRHKVAGEKSISEEIALRDKPFVSWSVRLAVLLCKADPKVSCIYFQVELQGLDKKLLMVTLNLLTEDRMVKFDLVADTDELQSLRQTERMMVISLRRFSIYRPVLQKRRMGDYPHVLQNAAPYTGQLCILCPKSQDSCFPWVWMPGGKGINHQAHFAPSTGKIGKVFVCLS